MNSSQRAQYRKSSKLIEWMDAKLYPDQGDNWDDEMFRTTILEHLDESAQILDLGAGSGHVSQMDFRGMAARVCGVDSDDSVLGNPFLDEGRIGQGDSIPYADGSFDVVFADNFLEHLEKPLDVFREIYRVLKPGGFFVTKTPNKWHYAPVLARFTPYWFHVAVNRLRGRSREHTFPTWYRANTPGEIRGFASESGLEISNINLVEGRPEYMRICAPTYLMGWIYERCVNLIPGGSRFRVIMIATMQKPGSEAVGDA